MNSTLTSFFITLFIVIGALFAVHLVVLNLLHQPLFDHLILEAYVLNSFLAAATFSVLFVLRHRMKTMLGFLFILASFVKFGLFFIYFNGPYKADDQITTYEFTAFFIPYFSCLILELKGITNWLNKLDENPQA